MKIFFYNTTIINLADLSFIKCIEVSTKTTAIHFHMKTKGEVAIITVPTKEVSNLLNQCYEIMKEED